MNKIDNVRNSISDIYFVFFMIIGSIFILNFSVTCIIDSFVALREKMEGDAFSGNRINDEKKHNRIKRMDNNYYLLFNHYNKLS